MLKIYNANENNLKNINLDIPLNKIVCLFGISGSGKSSLMFDTIHKESLRRFMETVSPYYRRYINNIERPNIEKVENLPPTIYIDKKTSIVYQKSTIGTLTGIYEYLKKLYCKISKTEIKKSQINDSIYPYMFSFNSKIAYCSKCKGSGEVITLNKKNIFHNPNLTLEQYISNIIKKNNTYSYVIKQVQILCNQYKISSKFLIKNINTELINKILYGTCEDRDILEENTNIKKSYKINFSGIINIFNETIEDNFINKIKDTNIIEYKECPLCHGDRLNTHSLSYKILNNNITKTSKLELSILSEWLDTLSNIDRLNYNLINTIKYRLKILIDLGLEYLSLNRNCNTLSYGELKRLRIACQINSKLNNILYILDKPSIGLHKKDIAKLIKSFIILKNKKNSLIIIDNNNELIKNSDYLIEMGPGSGQKGGYIIFEGYTKNINYSILENKYVKNKININVLNKILITENTPRIIINNCNGYNLKNININIPLNCLTVVCGTSGSGKSTLINKTLYPAIYNKINTSNLKCLNYKSIEGLHNVKEILKIEVSRYNKSYKSNTVTLMGIYSEIKKIFSNTKISKIRGYTSSTFSLTNLNSVCKDCKGKGIKNIKTNILNEIEVICDTCEGKKFNKEILEIKYKNKSIGDILAMTISESIDIFYSNNKIAKYLEILEKSGLGHIKLGQPSHHFSTGEYQKIKILKELYQNKKRNTIYIFDEPTCGLNYQDINILVTLFNKILNNGNTIIIIEHNTDIIKMAHHIIEIGPGGGEKGGQIIFQGSIKNIYKSKTSIIKNYLI